MVGQDCIAALETRAFDLWKVDVTPEYKSLILTELVGVIKRQQNQTANRLFKSLQRTCFNITRVEFDCALASLQLFGIVGIYRISHEGGETIHVNYLHRKARIWKKYLRYLRQYQPVAVV